ncbi:MAG: hypothetical protein ACI9DK_003250 [Vicingaceae bacterium]|jgi:hypothetical protein
MKKLLLVIIIVTIGFSANAQSSEQNEMSRNSIYFDTGVIPGVHAFVNYERSFYQGEKVSWFGRVGFGYGGLILGDGGFGGLGAVTMLTGKKNSHFELNTGVFSGKETDGSNSVIFPLLDAGYRYQKPDGGFVFKAKIGILGVGIGLGYAF